MNSGSNPCAPRYLTFTESPPGMACWLPPASLPVLPLMRPVESVSLPCILAITCSTGPPGTNWMTAKVISMIPIKVGIISRMRFRM